MGFIKQINHFCTTHPNAFSWFLFGTLTILIVLFIISLVHVILEARYKFVIVMNIAILLSIVFYFIQSYLHIYNEGDPDIWFFLTLLTFTAFHWALAFQYFKCSNEMDFVFKNCRIPKNKSNFDRNIYWVCMALTLISTTWTLLDDNVTHGPVYWILFTTNMGFLILSSVLMIVALFKIQRFLKR